MRDPLEVGAGVPVNPQAPANVSGFKPTVNSHYAAFG